jgi:hypothetical protein
MIASSHPIQSIDACFLAMLPDIRRYARCRFRHLRWAAREEAVAEVVAAALIAHRRLAERGRQSVAFASTLAKYAVCHVRNGRHVGGHESSRDVLSRSAQQRRGFQVESIDEFVHHDNEWVEAIVVEDRRATPADVAVARLDTSAWLGTLSCRNRRLARVLATGETTKRAAERFGVTQGRISQLRDELRRSWGQFQGEPESAHDGPGDAAPAIQMAY